MSGSSKIAAGKDAPLIPKDVIESIRRNKVCLKGTLFTQLGSYKGGDTQSLNVQLRRELDLQVNLVHGFSIP